MNPNSTPLNSLLNSVVRAPDGTIAKLSQEQRDQAFDLWAKNPAMDNHSILQAVAKVTEPDLSHLRPQL